MWKQLPYIDMFLFMDITKSIDTIKTIHLFFTDFQEMWIRLYNEQEFLDTMKSCNTILEMNEKELFNKGINLLLSPEELKKVTLNITENEINVTMLKSFGYPVKLTVNATKSSEELKVTYPLLLTVQDLKASQQELCTLLVKKDEEINEYKEEGGQIALRHLKTPKFDEASHISAHIEFSRNFAFRDLPEYLARRTKEVIIKEHPEDTKIADLSQKPVVKTEEHSQPHASPVQIKGEPESKDTVKQEIPSQSSLVTRKRPRKLNYL